MPIAHLILAAFIVLCVIALFLWGVRKLGLPEPFQVAIYVTVGILLLLALLNYVNHGTLGLGF